MSAFIFIQSLMSPFADGTSPVRFVFFAFFSLVVVLVSYLARPYLPQVPEKIDRVRRTAFYVALGSVFLLALSTLLMQVLVFHALQIPQHMNATFMTSDEITNTRLIQNHFGKIALGVLTPFLPDWVEGLGDTGSALVSLVPYPVAVLLPLMVLFSLVSFAVVYAATREKSVSWSALYLLLVSVLLQNLLDGGVLAQNTVLAGALLSILILAQPQKHIRYGVIAFAVYALGALTLWISQLYGGSFTYERTVGAGAVLLLCVYVLHQRALEKKRNAFVVGLAFASIAAFALNDSHSLRAYIHTPLNPELSVLAAYPSEAEAGDSYERVGNLRIYPLEPGVYRDVANVIATYTLPYWYYPVSVSSWQSCKEGTELRSTFIVLSREQLALDALTTERVRVSFTEETATMATWYRYSGSLTMNGCTPRLANILHEAVMAAGGMHTVLYGLRSWGYEPEQ